MNLTEVIESTVNGMGYELVDLEIKDNAQLIRIFIDLQNQSDEVTEEGHKKGVSIDNCVDVTNQLQRVFEVENIDYDRLEVSSPGLDRPLKKLKDYINYTGKKVQLKTKMPIDNRKNFIGILKAVDENGVSITLELETGLIDIEMTNIDKTRLIPVFKF